MRMILFEFSGLSGTVLHALDIRAIIAIVGSRASSGSGFVRAAREEAPRRNGAGNRSPCLNVESARPRMSTAVHEGHRDTR
ncbi:hypothetical protein [Defluviimonas sp. SAOS-178_SWC]|uniref:hypothetical protein n=1 Tax=Defluviimonas sp. SAOS-178_SWC TaxID=3121287 RepID=UPI0032220052